MIVYSLREFANNSHQVLPSKLFIAGLNCVFDGLLIKVHFYKNNILPSVRSIAVLFVVICVFHGVRFGVHDRIELNPIIYDIFHNK